MADKNPLDDGIVLALKGTVGGATYVNKQGQETAYQALQNGTYTEGAVFCPGGKEQVVACAIAHFGGASPIVLRLRGRRVDTPNVAIFSATAFGSLYTTRQDGLTSPLPDGTESDTAAEHVIDPADGADQVIWFLTNATRSVDECKWSAKSDGAPHADDSIVVAVQP